MFPTLFSLGPVQLHTLTLFSIFGFFFSSFIFWRKGREEHYSEGDLFDGFVVSTILGVIASRVAFVVFNLGALGWNVTQWINIIQYPGTNLIIGLAVATLYLYKYSLKRKWDAFEVLDFWVTSISLGLAIYYFGTFLNGTGYGYATSLPIGMIFPQLLEPHHPAQLYSSAFYFSMYYYLRKVEYMYRTFDWYRYGKKSAQTGFLTSSFLILVAIFTFLMTFVRPATIEIYGTNLDLVLSLLLFLAGVLVLYSRSGRPLPFTFKRSGQPQRIKLENLK
jgi:phosphatidylglycerol---prolipoprotein diacylglyceryl transferase